MTAVKDVKTMKKWTKKKKQLHSNSRCYTDMEKLGIAIFGLCRGTDSNKSNCKECKHYCEVEA